MKKQNKYEYLLVIQGYYGYHGWEDVDSSENKKEIRTNLRLYRENELQYPHRLIKRRVLKENNESHSN